MNSTTRLMQIGGLIAVSVGVTAILVLALATVFVLAFQVSSPGDAVTGVATAAFGVIGSVVGAYFGVKVGTDQAKRIGEDAAAANARASALALHVPSDAADAAAKAANDAVTAARTTPS